MIGSPITKYQAADIRARSAVLRAWVQDNKTNSYRREKLPADINPPTNDELSQCEIFEFLHDPPQNYFCYLVQRNDAWYAATWMGADLSEGRCELGNVYCSNMGDKRRAVRFRGINGRMYAGTFFCGAGEYARIKVVQPTSTEL